MPTQRPSKSRRIVLRGSVLFEALAKKGANTDTEIADLLGVNRMSVLRVRLGHTRPGVVMIAGALRVTGLSFEDLFRVEERDDQGIPVTPGGV